MNTHNQKILIVSTHPTHPTDAGNRAAIMSQVYMLESIGCEVYFLYAETSLKPNNYKEILRGYWGDRLLYYNEPKICKVYRRIIDKVRIACNNSYWKCDDHYVSGLAGYVNQLNDRIGFDACIVHYMRLSKLLPQINISRKAIFTHDVFSYKDLRVGGKFYETVDANQEAKAMQRCPNIFAIQETEATYYKFLSPKSEVYTVYNPYKVVRQSITNNSTILFIAGCMDFNINGITYFLDNIWPDIIAELPDVRLKIGGAICKKLDREYPNVTKVGRVENLDDFYALGDIVINPIYQGTGLKIKTFEALSYGKAVVAHPHSIVGIFDKSNSPIYCANSKAEWIEHIRNLTTNTEHMPKLQSRSIKYIESMNSYIYEQYSRFINQ